MPKTSGCIRTVVLTLLFFLGGLVVSCANNDTRLSPAAPTTPDTMVDRPNSPADASSEAARDSRSLAPLPADVPPGVSRFASFAVHQPLSSIFHELDGALDEVLSDLPIVIEQAVDAGQSEANIRASLVPGLMGTVGRLVTLTDEGYVAARPKTVNASTRSVPCNECSDNLTGCLDDALDNFVDCVFDCGAFGGGCRRDCRDTWRAEKSACRDAHRDCVRTCTPK